MESIAIGGGDIRSLLAIWDADGLQLARLHFAALLRTLGGDLWFKPEKKLGSFWGYAPAAEHVFIEWLRDPEHRTRLEQATVDEPDEASFKLLYDALTWVCWNAER